MKYVQGRDQPIGNLGNIIQHVTGSRMIGASSLSGGCLADLKLIELENGDRLVLKQGDNLGCEAFMLGYLRAHTALPVPEVYYAADEIILMEFLPGQANSIDTGAERELGEMVAVLHEITRPRFGFDRDTVIGPLGQPNDDEKDWCVFFQERRLLHMAEVARQKGKLPDDVYGRVQQLADRLDLYIGHEPAASLLHGDLWGGNILSGPGRVTGIIDPAIYFGDAEVELAFMTLFGTVSDLFFDSYRSVRPLEQEFFRTRRELYLTYPLLVHVALFGGGYVGQLDSLLRKYL